MRRWRLNASAGCFLRSSQTAGPQMSDSVKIFAAVAGFAVTMPAANWLIGNVGSTCIPDGPCLIPVGFGMLAPSGVLMIGAALVLRDAVHEVAGAKWAAVAIMIGAALSFATSPAAIAFASAVSFALAELADMGVYSRLRRSGRHWAVIGSGVVGAVLDSILFVWLAFGALELAAGTAIAKVYASALVALILWRIAQRKVGA